MAHHIVSAEAAWVTESTAQVQLTFDDGEVVPVEVTLPPPPGSWGSDPFSDVPQQFWPDELDPEVNK
jgi:hypothetical protein